MSRVVQTLQSKLLYEMRFVTREMGSCSPPSNQGRLMAPRCSCVHAPRLAYFDVKGCVIYALADGARSKKLQERNRLYIQCSSLDRLVLKGRGCFDNLHTQRLHSDLVALFFLLTATLCRTAHPISQCFRTISPESRRRKEKRSLVWAFVSKNWVAAAAAAK